MPPSPISCSKIDQLPVSVFSSNDELGAAAAVAVARRISDLLATQPEVNLIFATGNSQLTFLDAIRSMPVDWQRANIFHMDEYVGISPKHPASFPRFLRDHLVNDIKPKHFYPIQTSKTDPAAACNAYAQLLSKFPTDICILGIGENGHIAFNDPPYADFNDPLKVKIVELDQRSRMQQVGEGHFKSLDEVPTHAVTLTIPCLLSAKSMLCLVPEARKATAVRSTLLGAITPACPASILRQAPHCQLFLDQDSSKEVSHVLKPCA